MFIPTLSGYKTVPTDRTEAGNTGPLMIEKLIHVEHTGIEPVIVSLPEKPDPLPLCPVRRVVLRHVTICRGRPSAAYKF